MKITDFTAYKIVILNHGLKDEYSLYQKGCIFPVKKWDMNALTPQDKKKALEFDKVRQSINESLPSRIEDNIFVFSNKDYHQRWCTRLIGNLDEPYLLLTLSLTGDITWFDSRYYLENSPKEYWETASDDPINAPLNEGIFSGEAKIIDVKMQITRQ